MKQLRQTLITLIFFVFSLSLAILITFLISPNIYSLFIQLFKLDKEAGLTHDQLMYNYNYILDYLCSWHFEIFDMPYFTSSEGGAIHFKEVGSLLRINFTIMFISLIFTILSFKVIKKRRWKFQMKPFFTHLQVLPVFLLCLMVLFFDSFFLFFHRVLFNNELWLFNPQFDPIITVLPQEFFMALFVIAILIYELIIIGLKVFNSHLY